MGARRMAGQRPVPQWCLERIDVLTAVRRTFDFGLVRRTTPTPPYRELEPLIGLRLQLGTAARRMPRRAA